MMSRLSQPAPERSASRSHSSCRTFCGVHVFVFEEAMPYIREELMKLRNLYLLNSVVSLGFALGFLLLGALMLNLFGMDNTADARTLGQLIAVELVVGGVITLLARDVIDPVATRAINTGNVVAGVIGTAVALFATLSGVMGWFGYVVTAVYLFIAVAFGYFQFMRPSR